MQAALQGPVQDALKLAQDEDRARTSAAAEVLAGMLASSTTFAAASGNHNSTLFKCESVCLQQSWRVNIILLMRTLELYI